MYVCWYCGGVWVGFGYDGDFVFWLLFCLIGWVFCSGLLLGYDVWKVS